MPGLGSSSVITRMREGRSRCVSLMIAPGCAVARRLLLGETPICRADVARINPAVSGAVEFATDREGCGCGEIGPFGCTGRAAPRRCDLPINGERDPDPEAWPCIAGARPLARLDVCAWSGQRFSCGSGSEWRIFLAARTEPWKRAIAPWQIVCARKRLAR